MIKGSRLLPEACVANSLRRCRPAVCNTAWRGTVSTTCTGHRTLSAVPYSAHRGDCARCGFPGRGLPQPLRCRSAWVRPDHRGPRRARCSGRGSPRVAPEPTGGGGTGMRPWARVHPGKLPANQCLRTRPSRVWGMRRGDLALPRTHDSRLDAAGISRVLAVRVAASLQTNPAAYRPTGIRDREQAPLVDPGQ